MKKDRIAIQTGVDKKGNPVLFGDYSSYEEASEEIPQLQQGYGVDGMKVVCVPEEPLADKQK